MDKPQSPIDCPIDLDELLEIMDHDDELLKECLADFVNDYQEMLNQIRSAIQSNNGDDLEISAHAMKGSLRYLAAFTAAGFALQLETMGKSGGTDGVFDHFANLENECERIRSFIDRYTS